MDGWEVLVDSEGQTYYYHKGHNSTQWDPPQLQTELTKILESDSKQSVDEQIACVFRRYDKDKSGALTIDTFQQFYRALLGRGSASISDAHMCQVFCILDASGDGVVTLEEFQFWWKTKIQIEEKETIKAEAGKRDARRRDICRQFLDNTDAIVLMAQNGTTEECFESNLLPRLVALLGDFPLRGITYRQALFDLVADPMQQLVSLERFLVWYDHFESAERKKLEIERAKLFAQVELRTQQEAEAAAREKQCDRKQGTQNKHDVLSPELETDELRDKKIAVLFNTFDTDHTGLLDSDELLLLIRALGHEMNLAQVNRTMKVMDVSGDGRINLEEFLAFWKAFKQHRPNVATLQQNRCHAVSAPVPEVTTTHHLTSQSAVTSLATNLEMVKEKAFKLTVGDLRKCMTSWRDTNIDEGTPQKVENKVCTSISLQRHVYGARHVDVTMIEPEVVDCIVAILTDVNLRFNPPRKTDSAQRIQALVRGHLARKEMFVLVCNRYQMHLDALTRLYYFTDTQTGSVLLSRPLFPTSTSAVDPLERENCLTKAERYQFDKRLTTLRAKKKLYDQVCLSSLSGTQMSTSNLVYTHRPMLAMSAFYMHDVTSIVQQRLCGNIWTHLRSSTPEKVLLELIARRRPRQLMQRSHDAAALPLHYVVRHLHLSVTLVRTIVDGYPRALTECDALGMTPLHIALRKHHSSIEVLILLAGKKALAVEKLSMWARQTMDGDTPLHLAMRHRTSSQVLQWAFPACAKEIKHLVPQLLNVRGESAFHRCITQQQRQKAGDFTTPQSQTAVLLFFKYFDTIALCTTPTKQGDVPLHLAMNAFHQCKHRATDDNTFKQWTPGEKHVGSGWLWFIDLLLFRSPEAVLIPKRRNGLLPVHLAIKHGIPADLVDRIFTLTVNLLLKSDDLPSKEQEMFLLSATTISATRTTLLHYALIHRPEATSLLSALLSRMPISCRTKSLLTGDLPIHLAAAAHGLHIDILHKLCTVYDEGCRTYNNKQYLPLHMAIVHDVERDDKAKVLLQYCDKMILAHSEEHCGLRALLMAANTKVPAYRMLLTLLNVTPSNCLAFTNNTSRRQCVAPLYALSMRRCTPEITKYDVAKQCSDKIEPLEDEKAYFLALAKCTLRKHHYNPTIEWTFIKIVDLMERNPLNEGLIQRALYAINKKLKIMTQADERVKKQDTKRYGNGTVVDTVTLNKDLMLVRTVHQILYDFPTLPRLQILGQAILNKLLPSPYVRAAYRAKIDPYFSM